MSLDQTVVLVNMLQCIYHTEYALFICVELGYNRYKFAVQVVLGEQRGEGVK